MLLNVAQAFVVELPAGAAMGRQRKKTTRATTPVAISI
jgi:hypothetical protein